MRASPFQPSDPARDGRSNNKPARKINQVFPGIYCLAERRRK
jgi:hypothetical protein